MWVVDGCVYIEVGIYKVFGGHVVGDWGDVSKCNAMVSRARLDKPSA